MPILQAKDQQIVQKRFETELKRDVAITLYTQPDIGLYIPGRECRTCGTTQQLVEEVSQLSPKLHLEVVDFYKNREDASALGIEKIPAMIIGGDGNTRVRFYGLPSGLEFSVLLETLIAASEKSRSLQLETRRQLKALKEDVHIQVFVTPT